MLILFLAQAARPDAVLYNQARANMANILANQPNYTCLETIDRSEQAGPKTKFTTIDSLRFEVAFVDKREMYAWPGSKKFEETDLLEMVPEGAAIGTGVFAGHAQYLFRSNIATVKIGEWVDESGRRFARYPFTVPVERSGYMLMASKTNSAIVGYSGEIWIDPAAARVTRIALHADAIPPRLEIRTTATLIEYGAAKISGREFWLPARSVEEITVAKRTDRNVTNFSGCKAFSGESTLRFDDGPALAPVAEPVKVIELPPGLWLEIQLDETVDSAQVHVGDAVAATLTADIKQKGHVLFPKGSAVELRLVRLQRRENQISLEFATGDLKSASATARLLAVPDPSSRPRSATPQGTPQSSGNPARPGLGSFTSRGTRMTLRKGFRSIWITTGPPPPREPK